VQIITIKKVNDLNEAMTTLTFALLGGIGGLIRASIGLRKAMLRREHFSASYFFATVIIAALIGIILGASVGTTDLLALVAGYAGTDLLEGLAKSFHLFPLKK